MTWRWPRSSVVRKRLLLPAAMAVSLLLGLAYWWLGNIAHEISGVSLFILLGWHIAFNRIWFRNLFRGSYDLKRTVIVAMHLILIANMTVLLVTSVAISQSIFGMLPLPDSITLREVHWFSAYWLMISVGGHIGIHWHRVSNLVRNRFAISLDRPDVVIASRIAAIALAACGVWSFSVLGVWTKLTFSYSLDFWDFTSSVTPFFAHWAAVVALPAIAVHSLVTLSRRGRQPAEWINAPVNTSCTEQIGGHIVDEGPDLG